MTFQDIQIYRDTDNTDFVATGKLLVDWSWIDVEGANVLSSPRSNAASTNISPPVAVQGEARLFAELQVLK
jgi:hypothetical protein